MVPLPLHPLLAVGVQSPVPSDDGTSSVPQALAHGEYRIFVLLADLELSPCGEEVGSNASGQLGDGGARLGEHVAEEEGTLKLLGSAADLVLSEPEDQGLAVGVVLRSKTFMSLTAWL